jgi:hypothetical protein
MGLVIRARRRNGEVLIEDDSAEATLVYLVCRPWGDDDSAGVGVLVGPGEPPAEDKELVGAFPLLGIDHTEQPFRLVINTSELRPTLCSSPATASSPAPKSWPAAARTAWC